MAMAATNDRMAIPGRTNNPGGMGSIDDPYGPPRFDNNNNSDIPLAPPTSRISSRRPSGGLMPRSSNSRDSRQPPPRGVSPTRPTPASNSRQPPARSGSPPASFPPPVVSQQAPPVIPPLLLASNEYSLTSSELMSDSIQQQQQQQQQRQRQPLATMPEDGVSVMTSPAETRVAAPPRNPAAAPVRKPSLMEFVKSSSLAKISIGCCLCLVVAVGILLAVFLAGDSDPATSFEGELFLNDLAPPLDGADGKWFGSSLSMSRDGKRMAVADNQDVFVYDLVENDDDSAWTLVATIPAPENATLDDSSILSARVPSTVLVDLCQDGSTVAIGWPYSSNGEGLEPDGTGRVEVYQMPGDEDGDVSQWQRVGHSIFGIQSKDYLGASISMNEDCGEVAVASPGNDGRAGVFISLNQGLWLLRQDTVELAGDISVTSVSLKGNALAMAGQSTTSPNDGPVARIYRFMDLEWVELGDGLFPGKVDDATSCLVELSRDGNIVALSNHGEGGDSFDGVHVFQWDGQSEWGQRGQILSPSEDGEGHLISLSDDGSVMAIGNPSKGQLLVYFFDDNSQRWYQVGETQQGSSPNDQMGRAVALSGNGRHLVAGAPFHEGEAGRVYAFEVDF